MNSRLLNGLTRVAPLAMAAFSVLLIVHGVHHVSSGDPIGGGPPNVHYVANDGDPIGGGPPN